MNSTVNFVRKQFLGKEKVNITKQKIVNKMKEGFFISII